MTDKLTVRLYNVHFGDAILVTVPDRLPSGTTVSRRILVDIGNAPLVADKVGGDDSVFKPVIDDILAQLGGRQLDLLVITHEHLDHVQGLLHASKNLYPNGEFERRFRPRYVWLPGSAHPNYYQDHPNAKKKFDEAISQYETINQHLTLAGLEARAPFYALLANNNPQSTSDCVDYIRTLRPEKTFYIHRGLSLQGKHGFKEARFEIWAPEEDTSDYYGRFTPLGMATTGPGVGRPPGEIPEAPAGVDLGAFVNLVETRRAGIADNLLNIDKANNNSSIVFLLRWRGWNLLFTGDAEIRSWKTMDRVGVLTPVHFLKVSHHGSHNGTPDGDIFEKILPAVPPDGKPRKAGISTWVDTYDGIPHPPTDDRIKQRTELVTTLDAPNALFREVEFKG